MQSGPLVLLEISPHDKITITEQEIGTAAEFHSDRLALSVQNERAFKSTSTTYEFNAM